MNTTDNQYPPTPANISPTVTAASAAFKSEVRKVLFAIAVFFFVYLLLITASVLLAIACIYAGFRVMVAGSNFIGLLAGLGIISVGIMVFVFLVKFIFSVKKFDEAGSIEISEQEQPGLFNFIRRLTQDVQTQFPKKIVLSPEVNACVFYNDSFWSMLFPVKKNLQIGLGLVNTLTLGEFKAVMAHEFGHFSQRSMKLGSFVYHVNKAIYNMLYDNKDFGSFLQNWGNLHWAIGIFTWLTIQIITGIQKILQAVYGFINKSYMSLSREMEFHADAVAASVSGSNNCITALKKLEVSDLCYNTVIEKATEWLKQKEVLENVYTKHQVVMKKYAEDFNLPLQNNVPIINDAFLKQFQHSRVNIKNQWASHPSTEDRTARLNELNVQAVADDRPAWVVFTEPLQLQKQLSSSIYRHIPADMKKEVLAEDSFRERYLQEIRTYSLPSEYNGYYDNHRINTIDTGALFTPATAAVVTKKALEKLFSAEAVSLPKLLAAGESDIVLLQAIIDKQIEAKTFDYDGNKYDRTEAPGILEKLTKEIEEKKLLLRQHDEAIAVFFYQAALQNGPEYADGLKKEYTDYFDINNKASNFAEPYNRIQNTLAPLAAGHTVTIEKAQEMAGILQSETAQLKLLLNNWMQRGIFDSDLPLKESVEKLIRSEYLYFHNDSFFNEELAHLHQVSGNCLDAIGRFQFAAFKQLLVLQIGLYYKVLIK
jgi:Zn-dependent protease with chaperone function